MRGVIRLFPKENILNNFQPFSILDIAIYVLLNEEIYISSGISIFDYAFCGPHWLYETGTTTLQKYLFRSLDSVRYIGNYNNCGYPNKKVYNAIRGQFEIDYVKDRWEIVAKKARNAGEVLIYSVEGLSHTHLSEQEIIARRTQELVGDATILLTIRNQRDIAESQYFNFIAKGYEKDFKEFMEEGLSLIEFKSGVNHSIPIKSVYERRPGLIWSIWKYDKLIEVWQNYFDKVNILPLEAWEMDQVGAEKILGRTLDVEPKNIKIPNKRARSRICNLRLGRL